MIRRVLKMEPTPQLFIAASLLIVVAVSAGWDIVCYAVATPNDTVSSVIGEWAQRYPTFAIAVGVMLGHLFWPRQPPTQPPG